MDVATFLKSTITTPEGYLCIALRAPNVNWHEVFFEWPGELDKAVDLAYTNRDEYDVYFSSYLFDAKDSSAKANAIPSHTIQADLDTANVKTLPLQPGMLVRTSPGRYQAYWFLTPDHMIDLEVQELLSRRLTYSITNADRSGWSVGHKVRIADTFNHKYIEGAHLVEVVSFEPKFYSPSELELLPEVDSLTINRFDSEFIVSPPTDEELRLNYNMGPNELLESIRAKVPLEVYAQYTRPQDDRSAALWALMCSAFRAGLDRNQVYYLAYNSANNKFARLHYHAERELAKDVLRAEHEVFTRRTDPRSIVADFRKNTALSGADRKRAIMGFVYAHMQEEGDFLKTPTRSSFYVPRDTGKPVEITQRNENFDSLLDIRYNLNRTESEHEFTVFGILNQQTALSANGRSAALSYYDKDNLTLYVHSGRKDVYAVSKDSIEVVTDGYRGIVFPWDVHNPFNPMPAALEPSNKQLDWGTAIFGDLHNVVGLDPAEAKILLKAWFMFILFRELAQARPILALFGMPGSSKTTILHRIHMLLYGPSVKILGVTTAERFDHSCSVRPLVALDNVDSWEPWLPDRLAQAASAVDMDKRKLWSDVDTVTQRRQAMVALSAHNPKFSREDVTDRLLLFNMTRLSRFEPEEPIIDAVLQQRNRLWASVLHDAQAVLQNTLPTTTNLRFRIADFARIGEWIAQGFGAESHKTFITAIKKMVANQVTHNLQADQILVGAIITYITSKGGTQGEYLTQQEIYSTLQMHCSAADRPTFNKTYKSQMILGKKLWTLTESLSSVLTLDYKDGDAGVRLWNIGALDNG